MQGTLTLSLIVLSSLFCAACSCHPVGSVRSAGGPLCNPSSGECTCKPGVEGPHCDSCMMGYWGLGEYGCRPCDCTGDCDSYTGDCLSGWVRHKRINLYWHNSAFWVFDTVWSRASDWFNLCDTAQMWGSSIQPLATWDTAAITVRRQFLGLRSFSLHCTTLVRHRSHHI